ncbi:MAG: hypothetical protein K2Q34_05810 [Alphaproteobacteria bacterium]|nr:hypothetical protein [Alphaproteobacteria bacterium]
MKKTNQKRTILSLDPWLNPATGGITLILTLTTVLAFCFFFLSKNNYDSNRQNSVLAEKRLTTLQNDQAIFKAYEAALTESPKQFNEFRKKQFDRVISVDDIKAKLQKWQKQFKIQTLTTQFKTDQLISTELNLWKTPVSLDVKVLQDKQFYQFLDKIQQELPGVLVIKTFQLKRISQLTTEILEQVSTGKGMSLFEGKIEFEWIHLGTNQNKTEAK